MCEFCLKSPWPINEGTKPELIAEPIPDPEPETTFEPPEVITITCQGLDLEGLAISMLKCHLEGEHIAVE